MDMVDEEEESEDSMSGDEEESEEKYTDDNEYCDSLETGSTDSSEYSDSNGRGVSGDDTFARKIYDNEENRACCSSTARAGSPCGVCCVFGGEAGKADFGRCVQIEQAYKALYMSL